MSKHNAKVERNKSIIEMKDEKGMSFSEIGEFFNLSKQAAHQIYRREKSRQ